MTGETVIKYVSIDIETMGLSPECSVIEFAAVIDDLSGFRKAVSELVTFHRYLLPSTEGLYRCEPYCFEMHKDKLPLLKGGIKPDQLYGHFITWLSNNRGFEPGATKITVAGKNFASFDAPRIEALPGWMPGLWYHRTLDPSVLYLESGDEVLPNTATCLERAGLTPTGSHTALGDALDVVRLLRSKL